MNRFNKFLVAAFMSAAMLLPNMAQAMDIIQFDQMTNQDRQAFLDSLSRDAETVLEQEGRSADKHNNSRRSASATRFNRR